MVFRQRKPPRTQAHGKNYRTFYVLPDIVSKLDELKERWHLNGRGKVIERLVRQQFPKQQEETNDEDPVKTRL